MTIVDTRTTLDTQPADTATKLGAVSDDSVPFTVLVLEADVLLREHYTEALATIPDVALTLVSNTKDAIGAVTTSDFDLIIVQGGAQRHPGAPTGNLAAGLEYLANLHIMEAPGYILGVSGTPDYAQALIDSGHCAAVAPCKVKLIRSLPQIIQGLKEGRPL
jgi:hypothetical protein